VRNNLENSLPIMEQFYSIQGEGHYSGKPAVFIRIAGCDVGCVWCDVKESWDRNEHELKTIDEIVSDVAETKCKFVVITGGEPAMYDLTNLTTELKNNNCEIAIETSGVYPVIGNVDWVCFSPKKFKKPLEEFFHQSDELKVVVYNKSDLKWAEDLAMRMEEQTRLSLQPEWERSAEILPLIINHVKENPHWEISLQIHKFMNIP